MSGEPDEKQDESSFDYYPTIEQGSEQEAKSAGAGQSIGSGAGDNELATGTFVGREDEQSRFRELLRGLLGPNRGFMKVLLGSGTKRQSKVESRIQGRVILLSGPAGIGKTRLALRLRDISRKEKGFARQFRTTRLDWRAERDRDQRLSRLAENRSTPPEAFLDALYTHFVREDQSGHFEGYKLAVDETRDLARKVSGAELNAVWEFRAKALGQSLASFSSSRVLLFLMDNYELVADLDWLLRMVMEESGSQIAWIIAARPELPGYAEEVAAERLLDFQPEALSQAELLRFFTIELSRYRDGSEEQAEEDVSYRSPEKIAHLHEVTQGLPLAGRLAAFLLQTDINIEDLPVAAQEPIGALVREFLEGPLGTGHPDRLKLYALALLRRPERGVLSALLDLRQDLVPITEVLGLLQARYTFLFEPTSEMALHSAIEQPLRVWLFDPERRFDEQGLGRLNRRAMGFLSERLESWSVNFPTLAGRVQEIKWREWALDKVWHAFWLGQEEGWREALPLFVAALAYKPALMDEIVALVSWFDGMGGLDEVGQKRLGWLEQISEAGPEQRTALAEIQKQANELGLFRQKMPRFADELETILRKKGEGEGGRAR